MSGDLANVFEWLGRHDKDIARLKAESQAAKERDGQLSRDQQAARVEQKQGDRELHQRLDRFEDDMKEQQRAHSKKLDKIHGGIIVIAWILGIAATAGGFGAAITMFSGGAS